MLSCLVIILLSRREGIHFKASLLIVVVYFPKINDWEKFRQAAIVGNSD